MREMDTTSRKIADIETEIVGRGEKNNWKEVLEVVTLIIIVIITETVCVNFLSNISVRFVGVF